MENYNVMSELDVCKCALNEGVVKFSFTKINGEQRIAIGTRNPDILNAVGGTPKGSAEDRKEQNPTIYCFFDLVKGAWRCFKTNLFGHILYENMSKEDTAREILREARSIGEDELGRSMAAKFVPMDIVGTMFSAILDGCDDEQIAVRLHHTPSAPSAPSSSRPSAPSAPSAPTMRQVSESSRLTTNGNRADLIAELMKLRQRETEILTALLK